VINKFLMVGNKNGLLLPNTTTDTELKNIRNSLPDTVKVSEKKKIFNYFK